jgi:ABC-type sugar transport system substrate-binding protein
MPITPRSNFVALVVAAVAVFASSANSFAQNKPLVAFAQEGLYNSWRATNNDSILKEGEKAGYKIQSKGVRSAIPRYGSGATSAPASFTRT